ncbi:MAG: DUF4411 family protein [Elusimicrobia bacterium]|nr:DUF4411 family protein [Elusimicrobiota bacterium]
MPPATYLLDANVFIQAKNLHYGLDFCPAFWDWLVKNNSDARVFSIEKVGDEILAVNDELAAWADQRGGGFFLPPDEPMLPVLAQVSAWATTHVLSNGQRYSPAAVSTFLQVADYYLVAHALAHNHVVVTHEVAAATTSRIKIPNACIALGVKSMTPYEMLRRERALFVLGAGK